jgi:tryptophanase
MGEHLDSIGVPYLKPTGGHAIYLDAKAFAPHIPLEQFPGQAVACQLYLEGGIRSCEIGGIMFGRTDPETGKYLAPAMELVRLAFPRRVYTQSHFDYVLEVIEQVFKKRKTLKGFRFTYQAPYLRHFTAQFEVIG